MAEDTPATRDAIRSAAFGTKPESETITIFGQKVEVRQPDVGTIVDAQSAEDRKDMIVNMLINYTYVPGTNEHIFTWEDKNSILAMPVGRWFNQLNEAINRLTDIDIGEARKN